MGTQVRIVLYAADSARAQRAASAAFGRVDSLNTLLSDWTSDSELSRLSRTHDQAVPVSRDLWIVLSTAQQVAAQSGGQFDVTVGPLTRLWRWSMRRNQLPPRAALNKARSAVGYGYLELDAAQQTAMLVRQGMRLDLGGIAKGYAADEALRILLGLGFAASMVDAGGDMALGASPPDAQGWPVLITAADSTGRRIQTKLSLSNCGVAASGPTHRFIEHEAVRYSHIVSPHTGMGVTFDRIVTVIAPTGMQADAWASAYSVMRGNEAMAHAARHPEIDLYMVEQFSGQHVMYVSRNRPPK